MEWAREILARIDLALSLGEEPMQDELVKINMNQDEYNGLLTLNSMIENDIELIKMYNEVEVAPIDLLGHNYIKGYYPLLEKFDLAEFLPRISN